VRSINAEYGFKLVNLVILIELIGDDYHNPRVFNLQL